VHVRSGRAVEHWARGSRSSVRLPVQPFPS
jgi:hypothetical protein